MMINREKLLKELNELQALKDKVQRSLKDLPEGKLRCELSRGKYPQYYIVCASEKERYPRGRYLKKKEISVACDYAQNEYARLMLREIKDREVNIRKCLKYYGRKSLSAVYSNLPIAKRNLIVPFVLTDEEYIIKWKSSYNNGWNSFPINNGFKTEQGELVRSKSEKMIADKLFMNGIPYVYEAGLIMKNGKHVYPDFTMLNLRERETYYLEHFGMMDDPEYSNTALEKIDLYEENNIHLGDKLLVSFEASRKPINLNQIDAMIERYLK